MPPSENLIGRAVLVKLIGVNKCRGVTLKYFSILIKVSRKHRICVRIIIIMFISLKRELL